MCETTTGNNTVHMYMVIQFLVPGMEYLNDPGGGTEVFFISRKFQECFCTAPVEKAIEELLVTVDERV